jgi:hypothetical protein
MIRRPVINCIVVVRMCISLDSMKSRAIFVLVLRLAKKRFPRAEVKAQLVKSIYWPAWAMNVVVYAVHSEPTEQNVWSLSSM